MTGTVMHETHRVGQVKSSVRSGQSFFATMQRCLRRRRLSALLDLTLKGEACAVACGQETLNNFKHIF